MKKAAKRSLALFLALVMCLSVMQLSVFADDEETEQPAETSEAGYPAGNIIADLVSDRDGARIAIRWDEGVFPEDVSPRIRLMPADGVIAAAQALTDDTVVDALAVDITFLDGNRRAVQPLDGTKVHIELTSTKRSLEGERFAAVTVSADGVAEYVEGVAGAEVSTIEAEHFSLYAIIGTGNTRSGDEQIARRIYHFVDESGKTLVDDQTLRNGDTLVEPLPAASDGRLFECWTDTDGNAFTGFGTVTDINEAADMDEEVTLVARYKQECVATFYTGDGVVLKTVRTEQGAQISTSADEIFYEVGPTQGVVGWTTEKNGTTSADNPYTLDASVSFYPIIADGHWIHFEAEDDATYTRPQFVALGEVTERPAVDPQRDGYTFAGWADISGNLFSFGSALSKGVNLYASWHLNAAAIYRVLYWQEDADHDESDVTYSPITRDIETVDGHRAGETTSVTPDENKYAGFHPSTTRTVENKVIAADGSTIVNVYYDRNIYEIKFMRSDTEEIQKLRITARYDQNVSALWPSRRADVKDENGDLYPAGWLAWQDDDGNAYQAGIDVMPLGGAAFCQHIEDGDNYWIALIYYVEAADGTIPFGSKLYVEHHRDTFVTGTPPDGWYTTPEDCYDIEGYVFIGANPEYNGIDDQGPEAQKIEGEENTYGWKMYYDLKSYDVVFNTGNGIVRRTYLYGTAIDDADSGVTAVLPTSKEGYVQDGWCQDPYSQGDAYVFAGRTMPGHDIILYPKWVPQLFTVSFDSNGGTPVESQQILTDQTPLEPADPTKAGMYFAGWLDQNGKPFSFATKMLGDVHLTALWLSRPTLKVAYDIGEGSNAPSDTGTYLFNSEAVAMRAPTPPSGKYFTGWQLNGATYQPGETFVVDPACANAQSVVVLTAAYTAPGGETAVIYNANTGSTIPAVRTFELLPNAGHTVRGGLFSNSGYRFTGWNSKADGTGTPYEIGSLIAAREDGTPNVLYAQWERTNTVIQVVDLPPIDPTPDFNLDPTDVPDEDAPLAQAPEEAEAPEDIPDEEVPLAELPDEEPVVEAPEEEPELEDILDEDVPLADATPQTGDASLTALWTAISVVSLGGALLLTTSKRKDEEA